jgi:ATP-dependent Lhr-like helicase
MSTFARLPARLQEAIVSRLGWSSLRPVQELAGAAILDGHNAVVLAPTAGGKTEASMFPVLAGLMTHPCAGVGALYIAPIKALLNNQEERLGTYAEMVGLRRFVWHGDAKTADKRSFIAEPAELLMTTPESLEVMLLSPRVPVPQLFADLRVVVIDEVHALAGTDRGAHLASVLERIVAVTGNDVQRIGLSATVGNPHEILRWLAGSSQRSGRVIDPPKVPARRQISAHLIEEIADIATQASQVAAGHKSLFFCQSRALTETVAERMRGRGTDVFVHHSSVSVEERRAAEERFAHGSNACIVCTSTLELGIDVGDLDLVLQANAPSTVSSFLQRMGRTGRRGGQTANTTFYCETSDALIQAVALVELARAGWVESVPTQTRCWPVMVHQLLALTLQFGAISLERCWTQLSTVPDLAGIRRDELDALVAYMLREDYLFEAGGLLSMGQAAERVFGKKNFLELYAVFSSPVLYKVQTATKKELGSLEQGFVDGLVDEMSAFLLGGRAWTVEHVSHDERTVRVRPAPKGVKPSWGGFIPQHLGWDICQKIRQLLTETDDIPYLSPPAMAALRERREALREVLARRGPAISSDGDRVLWWTFAGGRINHTFKYVLEWLSGWKVVADNFSLRVEGPGVSEDALLEHLARMTPAELWADAATSRAILSRLPDYRLSKFQRAMPEAMALEMVSAYLVDLPGAARAMAGLAEPSRPIATSDTGARPPSDTGADEG